MRTHFIIAAAACFAAGMACAQPPTNVVQKKFKDYSSGEISITNIVETTETYTYSDGSKRKHFAVTCQIRAIPHDNATVTVNLSFALKDVGGKMFELVYDYGLPLPAGIYVPCNTDNGDRLDTDATVEAAIVQLYVTEVRSSKDPLNPQ